MMNTVASCGGGQAAASSIHINLFGPHAIVVHGTAEQKKRWLTPLIRGEEKACFGVTEPDAGLDTTSIKTFAKKVDGGYRVSGRKMWTSTAQEAHKIVLLTRTTPKSECKRPTDGMTLFYTDLDRSKIEVRRIKKLGRNAVDSNATFIDDYFVPEEDRIGEEGKGFYYLLDSLNPERILVGIEAISTLVATPSSAPQSTREGGSYSDGRSAKTRESNTRWPKPGRISRQPIGCACVPLIFTTRACPAGRGQRGEVSFGARLVRCNHQGRPHPRRHGLCP